MVEASPCRCPAKKDCTQRRKERKVKFNLFPQNGIVVVRNGIVVVRNGIVTVQNGIVVVRNELVTMQNGIITVQNGIVFKKWAFVPKK